MLKNIFIALIGLTLATGLYATWLQQDNSGPVACTADAMQCPDGSYVGRTGPNCEFTECPSAGSISSFEECEAAGYPVMESYPRQCRTPDGNLFVEIIEPTGEFYGTIHGVVMLGPTCPVEQTPPDPRCADKPYAASLVLTSVDGSTVIKQFSSKSDGTYSIDVTPGVYAIRSAGSTIKWPFCTAGPVTVEVNESTKVVVLCDSGIR